MVGQETEHEGYVSECKILRGRHCRAFLRFGCRMIVVDVVQSPAWQALTRVFTRHVGHGFGASYKISGWRCQRSSSGPLSRCRWWMVLLVGKTGHLVQVETDEMSTDSRSRFN